MAGPLKRPAYSFQGSGILCLKPSLLPSDQYETLIANNLGHSDSHIGYFVTTSPLLSIEDPPIAARMIMSNGQTIKSQLQEEMNDGVSIPLDSLDYIYIPLSSDLVAEFSTLYVTLFGKLYVSGNDEEETAVYEEKNIASQALDISQINFVDVDVIYSEQLWEYTGNDIQLTTSKPTLQDYSDCLGVTYNTDPQTGVTVEISEAQHTIDVTGLTATIPSGGNGAPTGSIYIDLKYSLTGYYATVLPTFWIKLVDSNGNAVYTSAPNGAVIRFTNNGMTKIGIVNLAIPWEFDTSNETFSFYPNWSVTFDHMVLSFCFFCPGKGLVKKDYALNLSVTAVPPEPEENV